MRWWGFLPHQRGWLSAVVLFVGTLLFAVSLVAAFAEGLTPRQSNGWIWLPDMLGCVCFLVSGHLAMLEVCHGHIGVRAHERRLVGRRRSTRSGRSCSSSPASRRSPARPPPARSTSVWSTGGRSPARSASRSAGSIQAFDTARLLTQNGGSTQRP